MESDGTFLNSCPRRPYDLDKKYLYRTMVDLLNTLILANTTKVILKVDISLHTWPDTCSATQTQTFNSQMKLLQYIWIEYTFHQNYYQSSTKISHILKRNYYTVWWTAPGWGSFGKRLLIYTASTVPICIFYYYYSKWPQTKRRIEMVVTSETQIYDLSTQRNISSQFLTHI